MAVAGCINAYDCAGCYLTTLQQLQSDNIGVAINYTAPGEYGRRQLDYIKYTDKCGCTCCLTGENELRIVATQGVIKNFTLTNDDTNEVVKVKWNDLFGSNRAYTMVRYKTGSYPTSISDGTLAVKETTQNQYSVSGYNVSGLTDGTTYYFTAFAVDSNNNVITSQNKNITPEFGRKPDSSRTLFYYKLTQNANDFSGNNRNGTAGSISFQNDGGHFSSGGYVQIPAFTVPQVFTYNIRVNIITNGNSGRLYSDRDAPRRNVLCTQINNSTIQVMIGNGGQGQGYGQISNAMSWNTRYNIVIVKNGATLKIYNNGTKKGERTGSRNITGGTSGRNFCLGNVSGETAQYIFKDCFMENFMRTDAEITKYYNQTKTKHGTT